MLGVALLDQGHWGLLAKRLNNQGLNDRHIFGEAQVRHGEDLLARNENPGARSIDAMIYAKLGRREQALRNLQQSLAADPHNPVLLWFATQTRSLLGLRREALDTLKVAVENGFFNLPMIEYVTGPGLSLHALRNDPEFHAIRADLARRIDDLRARY